MRIPRILTGRLVPNSCHNSWNSRREYLIININHANIWYKIISEIYYYKFRKDRLIPANEVILPPSMKDVVLIPVREVMRLPIMDSFLIPVREVKEILVWDVFLIQVREVMILLVRKIFLIPVRKIIPNLVWEFFRNRNGYYLSKWDFVSSLIRTVRLSIII